MEMTSRKLRAFAYGLPQQARPAAHVRPMVATGLKRIVVAGMVLAEPLPSTLQMGLVR